MKIILFLIFIIKTDPELKLVIELARHGARKDTFRNHVSSLSSSYFDLARGELSIVGMKQHFLLGKAIQKKYQKFIPTKYSPLNTEIISSSVERCILSAISQMQGIYDLGSGGQIDNDLKKYYDPPIADFDIPYDHGKSALPFAINLVPVFNMQRNYNYLFGSSQKEVCPFLHSKLMKQREVFNREKDKFKPLYKELIENNFHPEMYSKKDKYDIKTAYMVCDIIIARIWSDEDFNVPDTLLDQCKYLSSLGDLYPFQDSNSLKTYVTKLFIQIKEKMENIDTNKDLKFVLLSGHDTNIAGFLMTMFSNSAKCLLKQYENKYGDKEFMKNEEKCFGFINFTANIIFEVWQDGKNKFVKIFYNNKQIKLFKEESIEYGKFIKFLDKNIDLQFDRNCGHLDHPNGSSYFFGWLLTFLCIVLMIFYYFQLKKQEKEQEILIPEERVNL